MKKKMDDRITVRLYENHLQMLEQITNYIGEDVNISDIVRLLIEKAASRLKLSD